MTALEEQAAAVLGLVVVRGRRARPIPEVLAAAAAHLQHTGEHSEELMMEVARVARRRQALRQKVQRCRARPALCDLLGVASTRGMGQGVFAMRQLTAGLVLPMVGVVRRKRDVKDTTYAVASTYMCGDRTLTMPDWVVDCDPSLPQLAALHPTWHLAAKVNEATWVRDVNCEMFENPRITPHDYVRGYQAHTPVVVAFYTLISDTPERQQLLTRYGPSFKRAYWVEERGGRLPQTEAGLWRVRSSVKARKQVRYAPSARVCKAFEFEWQEDQSASRAVRCQRRAAAAVTAAVG